MARQSKEAQIESGILTPSYASELSGHARTTVRNWTKNGTLTQIRFPGSKEIRVSALELMKLLIESCWPFERDLAIAAVNYSRRCKYDHLAYTQEIVNTFASIDPANRKAIVFVPNTPEIVVWDRDGHIVKPPAPATKPTPHEGITHGDGIDLTPAI